MVSNLKPIKNKLMSSIQIFGIELRKANNMKAIYEDVDRILQKDDVNSMIVGNDVKFMTIAHGLQKMLQADRCLDVCLIKEAVNIANIVIPKERMQIYQATHCMHWNEMLPEFRTKLIAMVLDDFRHILEQK